MLGILIGYSAGYCFSPIPYGWRLIYDAAVLPALAVTVGAYLIPPSPRWLALRSMQDSPSYGTNGEPYSAQLELAHEALCQIRQLSRDETQYEFNQVVDSLRQQLKEPFLWREFLDNRVLWRGLIIGCGLVLFQQVRPPTDSHAIPATTSCRHSLTRSLAHSHSSPANRVSCITLRLCSNRLASRPRAQAPWRPSVSRPSSSS